MLDEGPVWFGKGHLTQGYTVVKVDRRIRWHYTATILRLRIGARLTRYRNCKFHNFARTISRHADGISRYSVPPSAGPLLPLQITMPVPHHSSFLQARCPSCRPTNSVKALKASVIKTLTSEESEICTVLSIFIYSLHRICGLTTYQRLNVFNHL